jgi:hypothetical protein
LDEAKACRIRIYSDHRFDVSSESRIWVGEGRYERDGDRLTLRFAILVHRGEVQRHPPDLHLAFQGEGNTLRVGETGGEGKPYVWRRQRL